MEDEDEKATNGTRNQMYRWWGYYDYDRWGIGRGKDGGKGKGKEEQQSKQGNIENTDVGEAEEREEERKVNGGVVRRLEGGGCWM